MELRIGINNRRKQFAGIGRDHLCDFQDGVQYQFPYPVRGRQQLAPLDITIIHKTIEHVLLTTGNRTRTYSLQPLRWWAAA